VFLLGSEDERVAALTTNCVSRCEEIPDRDGLLCDLRQIKAVISADIPLTPEARLESGNHVRVRSGPFAGYEGTVIRREGKTRLLLTIRFLEQGVSMELDEALLEPLS
jgi:transcriptional antiterminator RfaH